MTFTFPVQRGDRGRLLNLLRRTLLAALGVLCLLTPLVAAAQSVDSIVVKVRDGALPPGATALPAAMQQAVQSALGVPFAAAGRTRDGAFTLALSSPLDLDAARAALNRLRLDAGVLYANVAPGPPVPATGGLPTNRLIVRYKDTALTSLARAGLALDAGRVARLTAVAGVAVAWMRGGHDGSNVLQMLQRLPIAEVEAIAARIAQEADVDYAQPDYIRTAQIVPTDPCYASASIVGCNGGYQWDLFDPVGGINMPGAWDITTGSAAINVAVIDTGALFNHPDLAGRFVGGYDMIKDCAVANDGQPGSCTWTSQTPAMTSRDSDAADPGDWVTSAENTGNSTTPPYFWFQGCGFGNSSWHGTHVAGTIGAVPNNGIGIAGINWVSKIVPVRVLGKCGGYTSDIADAMVWAAGGPVLDPLTTLPIPNPNPARVLSLSLGGSGSCDTLSQNAITAALNLGAVVAVAAGNSNGNAANFSPASCSGVITVAATIKNGARARYSNYGAAVEIAAPGGNADGVDPDVLSTLNSGATSPNPSGYNYARYAGTSMATPHVTGVASLMLSVNPALTPAQVLSKIQTTARVFPTPGPACNSPPQASACNCTTALCGAGILNAAAAVAAAGSPAGSLPLTVTRAGAGTGTVTSVPAGITCGATCAANFASASTVTLTAAPNAGSTFTGWSGDCTGASLSCVLSMDAAKSVTATFGLAPDDNFPPAGQLPAGWTIATGVDANWRVASDSTNSGPFSLKSALIGDGESAGIQVSGTYAAGNVAFAYRVSSETNFDFLKFYIDGVLKLSASGTVAWTLVSYPVAAGAHTFKWAYSKNSSVSAGSDAAWIDSVVLPAAAGVTFALTVARTGAGTGTVTSNPAGISCGATCTASFSSGSSVTLTAAPNAGSNFTGWSGSCTGTSLSCVLTMNAAKNTTATFGLAPDDNFPPAGALPAGWTTAPGANAGWVVASDSTNSGPFSLKSATIADSQSAAIQVSGTYAAGNITFAYRVSSEAAADFLQFYIDGVLNTSASGTVAWTPVSFPVAAGAHTFKWVYSKNGSVAVGSDAAWIDTVVLPAAGAGTFALTVTPAGAGTGTVTSNPAGISCGATCTASFGSGSSVTLTAAPNAGSNFTGWSGSCTGTSLSCVLTMDAAKSATATFGVVVVGDDNFPPAGALPAGWTKASGADASWRVASDSTNNGPFSLKSAVISDGESAGIQVAGTYAAGNIAFAYRVSSEANFDFLRFYIDGVLKLSASGAVAWTPVSFPVAAGAHTFKWVYVKSNNVSAGSDAAWIDTVVLP